MSLQEQLRLAGITPSDPFGLAESVASTIAQQWSRLGPRQVKAQGKKYTFKPSFTLQTSGSTVQLQYVARKAPGDIMPPKVIFEVTYNRGADLYDVKIFLYSGLAEKITEREVRGLGFEDFAAFGMGDVLKG